MTPDASTESGERSDVFAGASAPTAPIAEFEPGRARWVWIVRRVLLGLVVMFAVSILVFAATEALPGDPASAILGAGATPARLAILRRQLGLDRPLVSQYLTWLGHTMTGNLGNSLANGDPVVNLIGDRVVNSAVLVLLAAGIAVPLSVCVGAWAGARRDRHVDHATVLVTMSLAALPEFVIGLLLVIGLSTIFLHILPSVVVLAPGQDPLSSPKQLILPVVTLVLAVSPYLIRLVRGSVIDVYESDYVRQARLKGVPEGLLLRRHVLRNALVPAIQGTSLSLAYLLGGIVVVESLFNYPGLGSELAAAVSSRDLPQIQAICLIFAAAYVLFNLVGDVLTVYATPRLRTGGR